MHSREPFRTGVCVVTKWCETNPNMSSRSKGLDCTSLLRRNLIWIRSQEPVHYMQYRDPFHASVWAVKKLSETLPNLSLGSNGLDCTSLLWKKNLIWIRSHETVHYMQYWDPFHASVFAVTNWSGTHPNLSLGPKGLCLTSSLRKNLICIQPHETVHCVHSREPFCTGVCAVTIWSETHPNMSLGSKGLDWTSSLRKNPIWIWRHDIVHYMHSR
jgi:hypothetical protein